MKAQLVLLMFLCVSAPLRDASAAEPAPKPNIVLLYIDDWASPLKTRLSLCDQVMAT